MKRRIFLAGSISVLVLLCLSSSALAVIPRASRTFEPWPDQSRRGPFSILVFSCREINVGAIPTDETYKLASDLIDVCKLKEFEGNFLLFSAYSPGEFPAQDNLFISVPVGVVEKLRKRLYEKFFESESERGGKVSLAPVYPKHDVKIHILENIQVKIRTRGIRSLPPKVTVLAIDEFMAMDRTEILNAEFCLNGFDSSSKIELDGFIDGRKLWNGFTWLHFSHKDLCPQR